MVPCVVTACSEARTAASFDASGVDLVAGSRAWLVLVVAANVIIPQNWIPDGLSGKTSTRFFEPSIESGTDFRCVRSWDVGIEIRSTRGQKNAVLRIMKTALASALVVEIRW